MKLILLSLFISISSIAFSQPAAEQKDSSAIVYIIRPTSFAFLIKMDIDCDSLHIGSTKAKKYVYTRVAPGKHVFVSRSENNYRFTLNVEAGKVYYIKQEVKLGALYAETALELLNEEDGKKYLSKCKLSKDNVFTN
jgi:hypothetical protein